MVLGIYGASGLGREVLELAKLINQKQKCWEEIIFIDDGNVPDIVNDKKVLKYQEALKKYEGNIEIILGIGEPATREKLFNKLENDGISSPTLIHPQVFIPDTTTIGKGVVIQYGCFISCNVVIEDYVFIQPQVNVGHDDIIKKGSILSGVCNLGGAITIGQYTYLGISSCVKQGITIGNYTIVGMGSVVYKDLPDEVIAMGNPARPMKKNEEHRVFN